MTITIPEKQYRKIWNRNYPDNPMGIFWDYMWMLHDTYGIPERCIMDIIKQINNLQKNGDIIYLRYPKGWINARKK